MKLRVVDCSHHVFHSFPPPISPSHFAQFSHPRMYETNTILFSDLFAPKTLPKSQTSTRISRGHRSIRQSYSFNLDDIERPRRSNGEEIARRKSLKRHCGISKSPFPKEHGSHQDSFLLSRYDFQGPVVFRIRPEFPHWTYQGTVMQTTIERTAENCDIQPSLRMIKKKLKSEEGFSRAKQPIYYSVKAAFASMVFIIVELQKYGSHMRKALCHENLDKDTHSSFMWLFEQVFSKTPALMLHVMILFVNFTLYSASHGIAVAKSMAEEATKTQPLDRVITQQFVSPASVKLEPDYYHNEYLRTEILYKTNLIREPNNPLLLCNYAQFLHLIVRDYDRAEACFRKAIQVLPPDAESLNQFAKFLHMVRMDLPGAEEMFLQALSVEPDNSHYLSTYANFLWSTGGDETCVPLHNSSN